MLLTRSFITLTAASLVAAATVRAQPAGSDRRAQVEIPAAPPGMVYVFRKGVVEQASRSALLAKYPAKLGAAIDPARMRADAIVGWYDSGHNYHAQHMNSKYIGNFRVINAHMRGRSVLPAAPAPAPPRERPARPVRTNVAAAPRGGDAGRVPPGAGLASAGAGPWVRHPLRRPLIAGAVAAHFAAGMLCFVQPGSPLARIPGVMRAAAVYERAGFPQTWRMFAPPSQRDYQIGYALHFDGGWTPMLMLDRFLRDEAVGRVLLPRGYIRVANHLRHPVFRKARLADEPFFWSYFQGLSAFFCFGDGAVPGLRAVRFYSVVHGIAPFPRRGAAGAGGRGRPPATADIDEVTPLYERECGDR